MACVNRDVNVTDVNVTGVNVTGVATGRSVRDSASGVDDRVLAIGLIGHEQREPPDPILASPTSSVAASRRRKDNRSGS